jgi:hypothetical protein
MVARALVPELVLVSPAEEERLLPEAADGAVETYAGNEGFEAYGYAAGGHYWVHLPGTASYRFRADEPSVVAVSDSGTPRARVEDAYLRNVLPLVLQLRGYEVLHASAVSTRAGLLVLCGVSGAGKSTFASALSERGYPTWADDAVVLDIHGDEAIAMQIPFRLKLRADDAALRARGDGDHESGDLGPSRTKLVALLVLGPLKGQDAVLVDVQRLAPRNAFTALLPHAYYFRLSDPARNALMLDRYLHLASSVPTFDVRYRRGLGHLASVIDEIEEHVRAA